LVATFQKRFSYIKSLKKRLRGATESRRDLVAPSNQKKRLRGATESKEI